MDDIVSVVAKGMGKSYIRRPLEKHVVTLGAEHAKRRYHTAKHSVLVADAFFRKAGYSMALALPCDDLIVVFISWKEIAECRMLGPFNHSLLDSRNNWKVHVGD